MSGTYRNCDVHEIAATISVSSSQNIVIRKEASLLMGGGHAIRFAVYLDGPDTNPSVVDMKPASENTSDVLFIASGSSLEESLIALASYMHSGKRDVDHYGVKYACRVLAIETQRD